MENRKRALVRLALVLSVLAGVGIIENAYSIPDVIPGETLEEKSDSSPGLTPRQLTWLQLNYPNGGQHFTTREVSTLIIGRCSRNIDRLFTADGRLRSSATVDADCSDGTFSFPVTLNEGSNEIVVSGIDMDAGPLAPRDGEAADRMVILLDRTPPLLSVDGIEVGNHRETNQPTQLLRGTCGADAVGLMAQVTNQYGSGTILHFQNQSCATSGRWELDPVVLAPHSNVIQISARDVAGNESIIWFTFSFELQNPVTMSISEPNGGQTLVRGPGAFQLAGTCSPSSGSGFVTGHVSSVLNSGSVSQSQFVIEDSDCLDHTWQTSVTLPGGSHTVTVRAADSSGFGFIAEDSIQVVIDDVPPQLSVSSVFLQNNGQTQLPEQLITGTCGTDARNIRGWLSNSARSNHELTFSDADCSGQGLVGSWALDPILLAAGENTFQLTAQDSFGNQITPPYTFTLTLEIQQPAVEVTSPPNNGNLDLTVPAIEISGTCSRGTLQGTAGLQITPPSLQGQAQNNCRENGTWSLGTVQFPQGLSSIQVTVYDALGLSASDSLTVNYIPCEDRPENSNFAGGDGSLSNPFLICSVNQFARMFSYGLTRYNYRLTRNLDFGGADVLGRTPITQDFRFFNDSLDGAGFELSNIRLATVVVPGMYPCPVSSSIFGGAAPDVSNLKLSNISISIPDSQELTICAGILASNIHHIYDGRRPRYHNLQLDDSEILIEPQSSAQSIAAGGLFGTTDHQAFSGRPIIEDVSISNLRIEHRSGTANNAGSIGGFFGATSKPRLKNLRGKNISIITGNSFGNGAIGLVGGGLSSGIEDVRFENIFVQGLVDSQGAIGGFAGLFGVATGNNPTALSNVHIDGNLRNQLRRTTDISTPHIRYTGGLLGRVDTGIPGLKIEQSSFSGRIEDSYRNSSTVSFPYMDLIDTGGLVGRATDPESSNSSFIEIVQSRVRATLDQVQLRLSEDPLGPWGRHSMRSTSGVIGRSDVVVKIRNTLVSGTLFKSYLFTDYSMAEGVSVESFLSGPEQTFGIHDITATLLAGSEISNSILLSEQRIRSRYLESAEALPTTVKTGEPDSRIVALFNYFPTIASLLMKEFVGSLVSVPSSGLHQLSSMDLRSPDTVSSHGFDLQSVWNQPENEYPRLAWEFEYSPVEGDVNRDRVVDQLDVDLISNGIGGTFDYRCDVNFDGEIDEADLEFVVSRL